MDEDLGDGLGVGEGRDEGEGRLAGGVDEWKDFVDPCEQSGPLGRLGGAGARWLGCWGLWLGRRGCGGQGKREILDGHWGGEGRGFVEAEAGFWILAHITRDLFEEPVDNAQMEVVLGLREDILTGGESSRLRMRRKRGPWDRPL